MTQSDRLQDNLYAVIGALLPRLALFAEWEYRIASVTPSQPILFDLILADPANAFAKQCGLPLSLARVPLWPGPGGIVSIPAIGSVVLVRFNNADAGKYVVSGIDPTAVTKSAAVGVGGIGASLPLAQAAWVSALQGAIAAAATAMSASGDPSVVAVGSALSSALAGVTPVPTTVFEAI